MGNGISEILNDIGGCSMMFLLFFTGIPWERLLKKPNRILHRIYPVRAIEHQSSLLEGILVQKKGLFARGSRGL